MATKTVFDCATNQTQVVALTADEIAASNPPPTIDELKDYAQQKRASLANGSTTVTISAGRSIPVWTDAESRGSILGLVVAIQSVPDLATPWKGSDGAFYTLDAAEIQALAMGMMQFVQKCFQAEAQVTTDIASGAITTTQAIDVSFATLIAN
jgi:hypothetical protein